MPYIKEDRRIDLIWGDEQLSSDEIEVAGELNFAITFLIKKYLEKHGECYQTYNDIIGALEGAKLELYARKIRPYEDKKISENGDVY